MKRKSCKQAINAIKKVLRGSEQNIEKIVTNLCQEVETSTNASMIQNQAALDLDRIIMNGHVGFLILSEEVHEAIKKDEWGKKFLAPLFPPEDKKRIKMLHERLCKTYQHTHDIKNDIKNDRFLVLNLSGFISATVKATNDDGDVDWMFGDVDDVSYRWELNSVQRSSSNETKEDKTHTLSEFSLRDYVDAEICDKLEQSVLKLCPRGQEEEDYDAREVSAPVEIQFSLRLFLLCNESSSSYQKLLSVISM